MRETQKIKLIQKGLGKAQKLASRIKYKCMLPSCSKKGIRSHSQQKKHQLNSIAKDLKVISVEKNIYKSFMASRQGNFNIFQKKQIAEASTFVGYCNEHDASIFEPIENGNLEANLDEHSLLLFLRCFSYEYANKRNTHDRSKGIYKECQHLFGDEGARQYNRHIGGMKAFLDIDAPYYFEKLFDCYETGDYSKISHNSFIIPKNIGISSTTCISLLRGNYSDWMSNHFSNAQPIVALSVVPDIDKTIISFVWLSEFDSMCSDFMTINLETENISKILNSYLLNESEDLCIKPSIWENLDATERKILSECVSKKGEIEDEMNIPQIVIF
ncbi:hypothetical protein MS2017_1945 [Bathymodiolus thermophilus thioautotrophic gill symbiont]|uniref:Uncharacterized protein n=1 Tax=Bathymodiolus thermophilus thioautotrophic gill symbiont TaxID=2360 RepID=A0A3G3IP58_9GAMM|nr:hypothetical protein [Bathymodiolus thermophilus thioautotrophic gill symbiont]AYQ57607.1 hypothetical protein MS2017_1945 [Bathymodiolus thermophilus thioautotrophic gill symbiont]